MKKTIFIYGILAGIAAVAYSFLIYSTQKGQLFTMWYSVTSMILYVLAMFFAAKRAVSEDFKVVLRVAFAVFLIANIVYYCFDFTLYNVVDKSLASLQAEAKIAYLKPTTLLEEQIRMEENVRSEDMHTVGVLINRYVYAAIGGFVLSVLVAYLIKRK
jgi:hypothetical protein